VVEADWAVVIDTLVLPEETLAILISSNRSFRFLSDT
jgi:hypothetical protein